MSNAKSLCVVLCALLFAPLSCGPCEPPPSASPKVTVPSEATAAPPVSVEELLAQWRALAKAPDRDNAKMAEAVSIALKLAEADPSALTPILDVVGDPAATPLAKVLAVASLTPVVTPGMADRLTELAAPGKDATTRACATQLLGCILGEPVTAELKKLQGDAERQVSFAASRAMALRDLSEGRKLFAGFWTQPETSAAERDQIVMTLAQGPAADSLQIFQSALLDAEISAQPRLVAAVRLGQLGRQEAIEALSACAEKDASEDVREAARNSIEAINRRLEGGADREQRQLSIEVP